MSGLAIAAIVSAALWLAVLSFAVLLLTRQVGLITVRLALVSPRFAVSEDGVPIGSRLSDDISSRLQAGRSAVAVLLLSATCDSCRTLAEGLHNRGFDNSLSVLVAGTPALAREVVQALPSGVDVRVEPEASEFARALQLETVPFGLTVEHGYVTEKLVVEDPEDLVKLHERAARHGDQTDSISDSVNGSATTEAPRSSLRVTRGGR